MRSMLRDISMPLTGNTPIWPGSPGVQTSTRLSLAEGDPANSSCLAMDVHTGTHVDAPRHFLSAGETIDQIRLESLIGPAVVADAGGDSAIGSPELRRLQIPPGTRRLLLRTRNSLDPELRRAAFSPQYAALTLSGANWVAEQGLELIGIDYLSIQRYSESEEVHRVLLRNRVAILEGLHLADVPPGDYELICLPLRLVGTEAAPARAVLRGPVD